jgi:hypothetical protein
MSTDIEPRPGTTASIDRRVEQLETAVSGLSTELAIVKSEASHTRELMQAGFNALNAGQSAQTTKLDQLLHQQQQQVLATADPEATPAGRLLLKEIAEARVIALVAQQQAGALQTKVAFAAGAIAVLMIFVNLLAPLARGLLGLP